MTEHDDQSSGVFSARIAHAHAHAREPDDQTPENPAFAFGAAALLGGADFAILAEPAPSELTPEATQFGAVEPLPGFEPAGSPLAYNLAPPQGLET